MLNLPLISERMLVQGLSPAALASGCGVNADRLSRWLSGESFPGPRRIRLLADALNVEAAELFDSAGALPAPQVCWLPASSASETTKKETESYLTETGEDMGRQLRSLCSFLPSPWFPKPQLINPDMSFEDLLQVVDTLGLAPLLHRDGSAANHLFVLAHSLRLFGVLTVPVLWTAPELASQAGAVIGLPDSRHFFVYINLRGNLDKLVWTLAEALGCCYAWSAPPEKRMQLAEGFADALGLPLCAKDAGNDPLFKADGDVQELLKAASETFKSPVYPALRAWQVAEGGRNPAFLNAVLGVPLSLAHELSIALYPQS